MSAMRLISGLPHTLRSESRYWVHATFVILQLIITIVVFWNYWNFASYENWTLAKFILILASPALVFLNACTLIPERADTIESWKVHYFEVSRRYFIGLGLWLLAVLANTIVFLDIPFFSPARYAHLAAFAICAVGAVSRSNGTHAVIAAMTAGLISFWIFYVAFNPGGLDFSQS